MHPQTRLINAPTSNLNYGVYLGESREASLREWCNITSQNYNTAKSRFSRLLKKCPFKNSTRVGYYQRYVFYRAINAKQPFDELIIPSLEDFISKVYWVVKYYMPSDLHHDNFVRIETPRLRDNLGYGFSLGESLELLLNENEVDYTPELLESIKTKYLADDEDTDSLIVLAYRYGQSPEVVRSRINSKGWSTHRALTTVSY